MIKFFRRIRKRLLSQNKLTKYLIYALGEVVLVVIGILISLQINNSNDLQKIRMKELHYLANLKTDLQVNMREMDRYLEIRTQCN